jgi:hypothetical protein
MNIFRPVTIVFVVKILCKKSIVSGGTTPGTPGRLGKTASSKQRA